MVKKLESEKIFQKTMRVFIVLMSVCCAVISLGDARLLEKKRRRRSVDMMDVDEPNVQPACKDLSKKTCNYERKIALMTLHLMTLIMGETEVINDYTGGHYDQKTWDEHVASPVKGEGVRFVQFGDGDTETTMMGHFYFKRKDMRTSSDSYEQGWQKDGTHGFCQTYAACGFTNLGVPNFVDTNDPSEFKNWHQKMKGWAHNSRVAITVVKDHFVPRYFNHEMWRHANDRMFEESGGVLVYPYPDLDVEEIQHDLDCISKQGDAFFRHFIMNEHSEGVAHDEEGNPACPDLVMEE